MLSYNASYLRDLLTWSFPFLPLLMLVALFTSAPKNVQRWERCFAAILFALVIAFGLIAFHEGPSYGPRYYYSGLVAIQLLGVRGLVRVCDKISKRLLVPVLCVTAILSLGIAFPYYSTLVSRMIYVQDDFERQVRRIPQPAVVFLARDPDSGQAPTRNRIDFQGDIVYALDLGAKNRRLMDAYPGRRYFLYKYHRETGQSTLQEITQDGGN